MAKKKKQESPPRPGKLAHADMDDAEIAERIFGKRLKRQLDHVIEDANKGTPKLMDP